MSDPKPDQKFALVNGGRARPVSGLDWLVRSLRAIGDLSADDEAAVRTLHGNRRHLRPYEDIVAEGDCPDAVTIVVSGLVCRYKILADGTRQILSFHIPGDAPDIQSLFIQRMDHSVGTLEDTTVLHVRHDAMRALFKQAPDVVPLFWRWSLIEASIFREWITNVGAREAYARIAHLLCEVMSRMRAIGLAEGNTCELPLTQNELGAATSMSTVHVNRTLQALRRHKLIHFKGGSLTILDWERLQAAGQFDPAYLHLRTEP